MSKWLQPPGQITKQPLVTRVSGVRGDEDARRVAAALEGPINKFLVAQAAQRQLSDLPVYSAHMDGPGYRLSYQYNHGQEYLQISVAAPTSRRGGEGEEDYWDFALIELIVPDMHYRDGARLIQGMAQVTTPTEGTMIESSVLPFPGVAGINITDNHTAPDRVINAANESSIAKMQASPNAEGNAFSLTVDLRGARGGTASVDLYSYIEIPSELLPGYSLHFEYALMAVPPDARPEDTDPLLLNYDHFIASSDPVAPILTPISDVPVIEYDGTKWIFSATGDQGVYERDDGLRYSGFVKGHGTDGTWFRPFQLSDADLNVTSTVRLWTQWAIQSTTGGRKAYSGPSLIPAEVRISMFKGTPPFEATSFLAFPNSYVQWTINGDTVPPMMSTPAHIPTFSPTTFVMRDEGGPWKFFDIPKLGTVSIDTHRRIKERDGIVVSASFNPS